MKIAKKILISLLIAVAIFIVYVLVFRYTSIKEGQKSVQRVEDVQQLQRIEAVITNIEMNQADGIEPDSQLVSKLEDEVKKIQKLFQYDRSLLDTMRMIHVCTYFNNPYAEELKSKVMILYNEEVDAFFDYMMKGVEIGNSDRIEAIHQTLVCANYIYDYIPTDEYDMVSKCVEWYNKYIELAPGDEEDALDIAQSCFWFLYEHGEIHRIDYMKLLPYSQKYIDREEEAVQKGDNIMSTVVDASMCADMQELFGLGTKYKGMDQKFYEKLDSKEAFEYYGEDEFELLLFNGNLIEVEDLSANTFYVENINDWLMEYYNNFIKQ